MTKGRRGQTNLDGRRGEGPSRVISMRLSRAHIEALEAIATKIGAASRAGAARFLIEDYLHWDKLEGGEDE